MARNVTLSTMITRVRRRADIESSIRRTTDQEIVDNLQEGIAELYDLVRGAFGQDYFRSASTFNTSNGVSIYALPADFLSLLSCDVTISAGNVLTARPYMENERNVSKFFPVGWLFTEPVFYRLYAANISFIPVPQAAFSVTLNYCPSAPVFSAAVFNGQGDLTAGGGSTFDGINGWEEYAVLDAAINTMIKDEDELLGVLEARKEKVKQRILDYAPERDAGAPERVHDVYRSDAWGGGWGDG